ncbi:MAG: protein kinase [bacterium]
MFASIPWPVPRRPSFAEGAPLTGLVLDGRYQLFEVVHRGHTTLTFRAQDRRLGRPCAVRVPLGHAEGDALRLAREAQALGAVADATLVALLDQGRLPGDGRPYLVLEWLEGETLREHLDRHGALPPARALGLARSVALALRALHGQGLVHGDVRPAHVYLCRGADGAAAVRLIGLAQASRRPSASADAPADAFPYLAPSASIPPSAPSMPAATSTPWGCCCTSWWPAGRPSPRWIPSAPRSTGSIPPPGCAGSTATRCPPTPPSSCRRASGICA